MSNNQYANQPQQDMQQNPQYQEAYQPNMTKPTQTIAALTPKKEDRFKQGTEYKDVWAAVLYFCTLAAFIAISILGISKLPKFSNHENNTKGYPSTGAMAGIISVAVISGFALCVAYFAALQNYTGKMIITSMVLTIAINCLMAIFLLIVGISLVISGSYIPAILLVIITLFTAYCFWSWRFRIPFAKIMLKTVLSITKKYPATFLTGFFGLVVGAAVAVFWAISFISVAIWLTPSDIDTRSQVSGGVYAIWVFMLFWFFWTSEIIRNTVHLTISGVFATYYFFGKSLLIFGMSNGQDIDVAVQNPTLKAFKRAMTTSFGLFNLNTGSNCYGSLLIAIVQTLKAMTDQAKNQANNDGNAGLAILCCCLKCLLACIEDILEYFNKYAFTQVAIYGKDYCTAAKDTWQLVKTKGIDAIINDGLIGAVLNMGAFFVALICCGATLCFVYASGIDIKSPIAPVVGGIIGFACGLLEFSILAGVVDSGIATTFVCLAEDPAALARTKPELYKQIQEAYPQVML